ncbi:MULTISPECIES: ABC transporter substrate-binding protein [unclassified Bradyrhizobium]|uniref:ABC transporter substrate-binding protein n=1 Tax=unclassified Bradyrhizobium TaxID=2631580 RepID=UPI001BA8949B|nr:MULTISPECIES: ABC transporter substrate-binding protein [unclassified Bradyrhizobium]MBR1224141.1 ABC transporter substrate-binding protein [Bradyrhizobium sp. AUGA SZCCT0176]MBR1286413.1 ABC transporter substrate-binding protein [Bradyrhizobium sp. AUGA SZCCT0177]MBR1300300.1 ABC transporter substrate-binding protein [Bradyrhizobium sp. AUGA SZCCT0042]
MAALLHRRDFARALAGSALWPLAAHGQKSVIPRVGIVWIASRSEVAPFQEAFRQGLRELGYVEGETIAIEARFAEGKVELAPGIAEELVRLKVDVIVAPSATVVRLLKQATTTIPIVMANVSDPVGFGFVASLQRPGGTITGFSNLMVEQVGKNVELCKEAIPGLSRLAVLVNPAVLDATLVLKEVQAAAPALGFTVHPVEARQPNDLEGAVAQAREQANGLLVSTIEGMFFVNRVQIIEAAARHRLPAVFAAPPFGLASAGALLAYGANTPDMLRRAASYVDRIVKGAKPADLPVQQPTKFELGVNLKTAKALGLSIPPSILVRADEVIE